MARLSASAEEKQNQEQPEPHEGVEPMNESPAADSGGELHVPVSPDPEVPEQAKRRRFSAKYKLRILREADACTEKGQLGKLLRREALYSSHLTTWRRQKEEGSLKGLTPRKRGRKANKNPQSKRVAQLERENSRLRRQLEQAETIIEIQKKVSTLFGMPINGPESDENS